MSVIGTTTNIWTNADCFTISNAAGAAGDNALKLVDTYFDSMLRLDDLEGSSIVLMFGVSKPQVPSSGARVMFTYGNIAGNTDGGYGIYDQGHIPLYSVRGGATWQSPSLAVNEPQTAAENDTWIVTGVLWVAGDVHTASVQSIVAGYACVNSSPLGQIEFTDKTGTVLYSPAASRCREGGR